MKLPPRLKPPPDVPEPMPSTEPSNLFSFGSFEMSLIVPPIEPEPYSVP